MINLGLYSSLTPEWSTPQDVFDKLNSEFHFTLDVCATTENAKCQQFYTKENNGLLQPWKGTVWMNPPYGREIGKWVAAAYKASTQGTTVVCLLPSRTDTQWFHNYVLPYAEIRFIKGRLKFGGATNSAPFPSLISIFRQNVGNNA